MTNEQPVEHHHSHAKSDEPLVEHSEQIIHHHEQNVDQHEYSTVPPTSATEDQEPATAEHPAQHHEHGVQYNDSTAVGHEEPVFDKHEISAASASLKEDQISPTEDEVQIHQEYHEHQQPIATGKFAYCFKISIYKIYKISIYYIFYITYSQNFSLRRNCNCRPETAS